MSPAPAIPDSHELRRQLVNHWAARTTTAYPWPPRSRPDLGQKRVCTLFFCSMDHCLPVDDGVIQAAAALAAELEGRGSRTAQDVMADLNRALRRARDAQWSWEPEIPLDLPYTGLLQKLLVRIAQPENGDGAAPRGTKLRLGNEPDRLALHLDLIDFLGELYRRCDGGDLRVGGAAALMAQALTRACGPHSVALWPAFLSPAQARLFPTEVRCLHLGAGQVYTRPACESGRAGSPESHSFPFEYGAGPLSSHLEELTTTTDGRVIVSAPPLHFDAHGRVERERSRRIEPVLRLLFSDEAGSQVQPVAREWKTWILTGLQGIKEQAAPGVAADLASIPPDVTLHVEMAGTGVTPWLVQMLREHVDSLGIGDDELTGFAREVQSCLAPAAGEGAGTGPGTGASPEIAPGGGVPPETAQALSHLERAAWLADALDLARLYVHGHVVDLVIRRDRKALGPAGAEAEMEQELVGTLFAKGAVASQAAGTPVAGRLEPGLLGLRPAPAGSPGQRDTPLPLALWVMATLQGRWGLAPAAEGRAGAQGDPAQGGASAVLKRGWFRASLPGRTGRAECMVVVVPVVWFARTPGHPLRTTGLGDVTSALSFYFGDYTVDSQAPKRGRAAPTA